MGLLKTLIQTNIDTANAKIEADKKKREAIALKEEKLLKKLHKELYADLKDYVIPAQTSSNANGYNSFAERQVLEPIPKDTNYYFRQIQLGFSKVTITVDDAVLGTFKVSNDRAFSQYGTIDACKLVGMKSKEVIERVALISSYHIRINDWVKKT